MCCVCAGSCNHVGNHTYCFAHGGPSYVGETGYEYFTTSGTGTFTITPWSSGVTTLKRPPARQRLGALIGRFGAWVANEPGSK